MKNKTATENWNILQAERTNTSRGSGIRTYVGGSKPVPRNWLLHLISDNTGGNCRAGTLIVSTCAKDCS